MTEIYLVRHGQSANNALAEHMRVPDPGLTDVGAQQAAALAAWFSSQPVDYLYCSPFLRALETVRPLAETKRMPVRVRADLFEVGGCYSGHEAGQERGEPGLGQSQLCASYPTWEIDKSIGEAGWWGREYETWEQGRARAAAVASWLANELTSTPGIHVLVIHADFKRLLLEAMLSQSELDSQQINLAEVALHNTGISCLKHSPQGWSLCEFNSTQHLTGKLLT
jgi:2,3-bisphosphoglycerate-dependent phosphoglycerate mutase